MKRLILFLLLISLVGTGCSMMKDKKKVESRTTNVSVEAQIRNKLKTDPLTAAWEINPIMEGNTITLTGLVEREEERRRANELARGVVGELRTVENQILLVEEVILDNAITAKLKTELVLNPLTRITTIDVQVRKGVVTLNGTVKADAQKREAERLAQATAGVMNVVNSLKVSG
ncbi:MAG: BON domain-containing protein [Candidatus Manganitrophaceae bacterium]